MKMVVLKRRDSVLLASYFAFLTLMAIVSWSYPHKAALFPRMLLVAGFFFASIELVIKLSGKDVLKKSIPLPDSESLSDEDLKGAGWRMGVYAACGFLYVLLMPAIGYLLTQFLILTVLLIYYRIEWKLALVISVATAVGTYLIFAVLLQLPLPKGILEDLPF
jgi:putative tricarboxylic transport membrane protein